MVGAQAGMSTSEVGQTSSELVWSASLSSLLSGRWRQRYFKAAYGPPPARLREEEELPCCDVGGVEGEAARRLSQSSAEGTGIFRPLPSFCDVVRV